MAGERSRIAAAFTACAARGRCALIPYVTTGFPSRASTVPIMHALVAAGADVIELGVPFSDPMADGPVVQRANDRALANGIGLGDVLDCVAEFRRRDAFTPVVLMGYCNPVERMGVGRFAERAAAAGVDGVLLVDCPPEEAGDFAAALRAARLDPIFLLAPTSSEARLRRIAEVASGYVYYVSLKGVTGAGHIDTAEVARQVPRIQQATGLPVGVGFGIKDGATAARIAAFADAVVIGSRVIEVVEAGPVDGAAERIGVWLASIRTAIDAVPRTSSTSAAPAAASPTHDPSGGIR
ncbi:MAG: tryptophan synthase subunit alpha [Lautropia sp.]